MLVFWIYLFIYSLLTISRDIVFGPPGRSKAAILFYFCNLFLWGYPVYFYWVSIFIFFLYFYNLGEEFSLYLNLINTSILP